MKRIISGLIAVPLVIVGSWALAQIGGTGCGAMGGPEMEMMAEEGHRYGMAYGYFWWWGLYGLVKAAVILFGLWLLYRITKAVEKIALSKS